MNLDGNQLAVGDTIHHLQFGPGEVIAVANTNAQVNFGGMEITLSPGSLERHGTKMVGRGAPLVVWPERGENVTRLGALITEARKL
jgi:hypothetical protein